MTKPSQYDPDNLQRRLQEIEAGTGAPYVPGEDPAIDAAMLMRATDHPVLSEEKMLAIGAGLLITSANPPTLSEAAFNNIEAMLQAQLQLQAAPQPVMSDKAVNALDAQLRLQAAPRPALSDASLIRIEQQLLQTARPTGSFMSAAAVMLLALFGVLIATGVMLNSTPEVEGLPTETEALVLPQITVAASAVEIATQAVDDEYSSQIVAVLSEAPNEDIAATVEPSPQAEPTAAQVLTEEPTLVQIVDAFELPPALIVEGTITSLDESVVVIYDMAFDYQHDTTLLDGYRVGDTVHIEGAVNPYTDEYLILSIEPVYDGEPNRPVIVTGVGEEPDSALTDANGDTPVTSVTDADGNEPPSTTGSTGGVPPGTECDDGDDANEGRGQECNRGNDD